MDRAYIYIKRLLSFGLCFLTYALILPYLPVYILLPLLVLVFSILHSRITESRPPHLFAFYRTENYFKKGGLRDLLRICVTLSGFIYDSIVWTVWGIYLIFLLVIDLLDFIKSIIYWVIHAILWFLRQYVPFFVFLYSLFIHYIIRWPWWLYQISYNNTRQTYNRNNLRIAYFGSLQAASLIFLFFFLEIIFENIPGTSLIGIILALLPITWSFGEIAAIKFGKMENEPYRVVRSKFQNGIEAVRSVLFYITLFVVLLLVQLCLNLLGWIPLTGILIAGIAFSLNTFISLILVFLFILIFLGVIIIPSHRLYVAFSEINFSQTFDLLKMIGRKMAQFFLVSIPGAFFSIIAMILPFILVAIIFFISYSLKNTVVEVKINKLNTELALLNDPVEAYRVGKQIEHLKLLQQFPIGLMQEIEHRKSISTEIAFNKEDVSDKEVNLLRITEDLNKKIETRQEQIDDLKTQNSAHPMLPNLMRERDQMLIQLSVLRSEHETSISKSKIDIEYLSLRKKQFYILLFLGGVWMVLFGSLIWAFLISYAASLFHHIYVFRNNNEPTEWENSIDRIRKVDHKQPLLGGTLLVISTLLVYLFLTQASLINSVIRFLSVIFRN